MDIRTELIEFVREKSYQEGEFILVSGKKSPFYIDLKTTTLHPKGALLVGDAIVEKVKNLGLSFEAVGGLTLGADPIATAVSLAAFKNQKTWPALIVRKEPKGHGLELYVEGMANLPNQSCDVLVLEDVTTTGKSSLLAVERFRKAGLNPVAVLTIVDREQGGAQSIADAGLPLHSLMTLKEIQLFK